MVTYPDMNPTKPTMFCMVVTPMDEKGQLDEEGCRTHLRRMVDAGIGVYMGSGGSGEGHALDLAELGRLYQIGVEECKGKVPIYCNPPEARSANEMLNKARLGVEAGMDMVQLYQLDAGHGRSPVYVEQERYFRDILEKLDYPVAISIHSAVGYLAPVNLTAKLCSDYPQIQAINLHGPSLAYFVNLKDSISSTVKIYLGIGTVLAGLSMGAWGAQVTEPNQVPRLCQSVIDHYLAGDMKRAADSYANVLRVSSIIDLGRQVSADGPKGAMAALGLSVGPPRPPRIAVDDATIAGMRQAFEAMRVFELEGLPHPSTK
ncbi:dihydrodipicolinate synthase family protein [Dehalococcoidia bacterium]|nr:dihydrodipicolinate synthase family protein [Dehalococcoidia bacterium]